MEQRTVELTETVLRDAHQSLMATRMSTQEMLPIIEKMDQVGYYSLECWGGATFDAAIRFLNEDPWERLRAIKERAPHTKLQMLLRGQNLLGYRHYADDIVEKFVQKASENGIDVFRIFDALNDPRNLEASLKAVKKKRQTCAIDDLLHHKRSPHYRLLYETSQRIRKNGSRFYLH